MHFTLTTIRYAILDRLFVVQQNKNAHPIIQITGMEMNAAKRLQFNLDVVSIKEVECMKNLPEVVMPLFWVEESAPLNSTSNGVMLKYQLFL